MLNIKINNNGINVEAGGGVNEIMAELCIVTNSLYNTMRKHDEQMASVFRRTLAYALNDPDSPVWGPEPPGGLGLMISMPSKQEGGQDDAIT